MTINIFRSVEEASKATGLAVIIDVFRAFSTEAYLFANGAEKIIPVLTLEEAYKLKEENPDYVLAGERGGLKPEGFDFGNSPTEVKDVSFSGKTIIHTTSNGTKGLINAVSADVVIGGSFVGAKGVIDYIKNNSIETISFVSTSPYPETDNEDIMFAYYVRDIFQGSQVNESKIRDEIKKGPVYNFLVGEIGVPESDIDLCLDFNRFDFIIKKSIEDGRLILRKEAV